MKKITISVPDDKVAEVEAYLQQYIQQLNISILKEDEKLSVEEWQRDSVVRDESTGGYISSDELEKTSFSREK
ncbi:MAG TPA: hypothetical protein PKM51_05030 [Chitinophagales bacterium]|nr:hypothetical protein [Chitinophagales bacterium]HNM32093.1 hypothetical protein [Chitinophagales bacterium]